MVRWGVKWRAMWGGLVCCREWCRYLCVVGVMVGGLADL